MVTRLRPPVRPLPDVLPEHVVTWEPGDLMLRVFHDHPARSPLVARAWGPVARFDPHVRDRRQQPRTQRDGRGVTYLGATLATCLAEAFPEQHPEVLICPNMRAVLAGPSRSVALLDLTGDGAMQIGAIGTLASGNEPRRLTQRWGRAIYEDLPELDGIAYRGAHQGGRSVALWDRAGPLIARPASGAALAVGLRDRVTVALSKQGRAPVWAAASECMACHRAGH